MKSKNNIQRFYNISYNLIRYNTYIIFFLIIHKHTFSLVLSTTQFFLANIYNFISHIVLTIINTF